MHNKVTAKPVNTANMLGQTVEVLIKPQKPLNDTA